MTNAKMSDRVIFPSGEQQIFLEDALTRLSVSEISTLCGCSERTIRDWKREKHSISETALRTISEALSIQIPSSVEYRKPYSHARSAGRKGGLAIMRKYGKIPVDEEHRMKRWREWRETEGEHAGFPQAEPYPIKKPCKSSTLAEFIGIMMGDGGMSRYQVCISLNSTDDAEYITYVTDLIEGLFEISPSVYPSKTKNVTNIVISRSLLVRYLHELGLPIGDKIRQGLDMPEWVQKNPEFSKVCVRGLVDTDGCVFTHRYLSKRKQYSYKKLSFTSASPTLLATVHHLLSTWGMHPRRTRTRDIRLDSIADMRQHFSLIGSHNPKHLKRYGSRVL